MPTRRSCAPYTTRPTLASTMAPAHCAHGSSVTYIVANGSRSSPTFCSARWMARSSACAVGSRRFTVSLCASARVSPSATMTAPTGISSRTDAARARRNAACMPCRSLGDGVPLRTGALGDGGAAHEPQVIACALDADGVALVEVAFEQLEGDWVLQLALDDPFERPRAVDRIVALRSQQLLGLGDHL